MKSAKEMYLKRGEYLRTKHKEMEARKANKRKKQHEIDAATKKRHSKIDELGATKFIPDEMSPAMMAIRLKQTLKKTSEEIEKDIISAFKKKEDELNNIKLPTGNQTKIDMDVQHE